MISTVTYNGDGATRIFPVAFEIKGEEYTVVYVGGVAVADRSLYDIINNAIVFNTAPVIGTNNVEIVVASTTTEIADLNAPPSTIQTVLDNMAGINAIVNTVIPNINEILLADDNATTATTKALEASISAGEALASKNSAVTSAGNALVSEQSADTSEANALIYKNSAETSATTATTQAGIATTKAGEASTSASNALTSRNEAEAFRDEAEASALSVDSANIVHKTGDETIAGIKNFTSYPTVNGISLEVTQIEMSSFPMIGLLYNSTDDTYKRIGKNINTLTIDGFNEFTAWRSPTAERQNDNDTVSASPFTAWLDTSANLPFSFMKRYIVSNLGAEVKAYNANSFSHVDQTGVTATQQVMVKIPKFNYIQAQIVDGGKTYYLYAIATASFTLNALTELGFISPTITVWNPTAGVSSGTVASNVLTSALHPAFTDNASNVMNQRYYGAFNAVSGRSICGSTITPTSTVTLAQCRTACQGFGTGFTQLDFFLESAKNILALVERGSHYFERGGTSLANKWEGYSWNTGAASYDQDNGLTLPLLNKTGVILDGSNRTIANSYRGIENYHSGLWRWVDGVSLSSNVVYLAKPKATFSDGTITTPYFSSGYTVPSGASGSYIQDFGAGSFIPTVLGGSASTKVTDAAWTGSTALSVGGYLTLPSKGGLAAWSSFSAASYAYWSIVARSGL